ncbi:MAG: hypothetical protein KatS3mg074_208 [Meiothermus sp.]|uniref:HTH luxR-type domain-containing protein n=2 Tax=Meiothermus hypogaeus TaxID=884155 RepID=A0A511R7J2_9DEIN|nr:LuxR C-terminal-related transcriptional regulator [Meiothermus hypogaeus]RIH74357.1 putative HTH-type transcriptional regulator [Meiothermus hypogaeus]GEM85177.1 hypothetical protein MHY01S_33430 [Meiothermus hypogaeus NBRC 106114]GIW37810.1 MAG: hypothetical protein KatS3mg074_208 [Meiothermus sp.]
MPTHSPNPTVRPVTHPALPSVVTRFIGREREIAEVWQLLRANRLLSLVGPGGVGKTRLALTVAAEAEHEFGDGVCWVELAQVGDPSFVPQTLAKALEVAEQPDLPLSQTLLEKLEGKDLLLILDNCEHLLAACHELVGRLLAAPALKILTTSREPLGVAGEVRYAVPPLSLPEQGRPLAELAQSEAVRLFVERARSLRPEFALTPENAPLIAEVCRRLDGLPLAIELASARVGVLSLRQLRERLEQWLDVLTSPMPHELRHRTLRSVMDWSYQLLSTPEQVLLQRLSLFASGFTLVTAEACCAWGELEAPQILDLLTALIGKSLVMVEALEAEEARYRLLETVRQYAREQLEASGAWQETYGHYLRGFLRMVAEISPQIEGPQPQRWVDWLEREHENLRVALEWACRHRRAQEGLRLVGHLTVLWDGRGHFREGFAWYERLLGFEEVVSMPLPQRMNALVGASLVALLTGDAAVATDWAGQAVALGEAAGEVGWPQLGFALVGLATVAKVKGDWETALALLERGIQHERKHGTNTARVIYFALLVSGMIETDIGRHQDARRHLEEALEIAVETGSPYDAALVFDALGQLARATGRLAPAVSQMEKALELFRQSGASRDLPNLERHLAYACLRLGDPCRAYTLFRQSLEAQLQRDHRPSILRGLLGFAALAAAVGLYRDSACLQGFAGSQGKATVNLDSGDQADALEDEHYAALVRAELSELELETATEKGRAMRLEEVVSYALGLDFRAAKSRSHDLTRRERDVAALIGAGLSNGEIAARLGLSKRTVEKHIANILLKLALKNRAQIVRWALEQGLSGEHQ